MAKTMDQIREDQNRRHRLSVEVAQRVLDLKTEWIELGRRPDGTGRDDVVFRMPMQVWPDGTKTVLADYSGDIGEAWGVVEAMQEKGWRVEITMLPDYPEPWRCFFARVNPYRNEGVDAANPAEAICLASLKALEREASLQSPR